MLSNQFSSNMAVAQVSNYFAYTPIHDVFASKVARISAPSMLLKRDSAKIRTFFTTGSPLLAKKAYFHSNVSKKISIRCEQSAKGGGGGLDVWLGRLAMVGFAAAISVELATGKGLLENFGLPTPLPVAALVVTALVGVLTAIFIFQSASKN